MFSKNVKNIFFYAFPSYLNALSFGFVVGYTSPSLTKMKEKGQPFFNDDEIGAWFGSIATIGGMLGSVLGGPLVEKLGRRMSVFCTTFPYLLGWIIISSCSSHIFLLSGRLLTGLGGGMTCVVSPLYVSELSPKNLRGKLVSFVQLSVSIGIVMVYLFGVPFSWRQLAFFCSLPSFGTILCNLFTAESPRFLVERGLKSDAYKVLLLIRDTSSSADDEVRDIQEGLDGDQVKVTFTEILKSPEYSRPLMVALVVMVLQQMCGINGVMFYTGLIFLAAGFSPDKSSLATCLVGVVQVFFTFLSAVIIDKAGRKILLNISGFGMGISCVVMAWSYHRASENPSLNSSYILCSLVVYIISFAIGWGPIPSLLASEIFPSKIKGSAMGFSVGVNWFVAFLVTKYFSRAQNLLGIEGVFFIFSLSCFFSIFFVRWKVPETKGKSLEDISFFFTSYSSSSSSPLIRFR